MAHSESTGEYSNAITVIFNSINQRLSKYINKKKKLVQKIMATKTEKI